MIRFIYLLSFLQIMSATAGSLKIELSGVKSDQGNVRCLLFSRAEGYPETASKAAGKVIRPASRAKNGKLMLSISGVKDGTYAVIIHHDVDGSGEVEKNVFGIPKEPIAISNWNGRSRPDFQKNAVNLDFTKPLQLTLK